MIVGLHHVAMGVNDFEKALKFYTEALGFEVVLRSDFDNDEAANKAIGLDAIKVTMAMLKASNAFIELYEIKSKKMAQLSRGGED